MFSPLTIFLMTPLRLTFVENPFPLKPFCFFDHPQIPFCQTVNPHLCRPASPSFWPISITPRQQMIKLNHTFNQLIRLLTHTERTRKL